jgi:beta-lactamase superfamily II metal-dependent hydrolase
MYDIDVLKAGKEKDADAITARFDRPDNGARVHVVVDAGWQADGDTVVAMLERYGTNHVDLAVVTHPDGDHIGGMGKVFDNFTVGTLLIHRLDQRGGSSLPAAQAVRELSTKAAAAGTAVVEPEAGLQLLGGALTILGPDGGYYAELVAEQLVRQPVRAALGLREAFRTFADRVAGSLPIEVPFDDGPGCGPRNNSSVISLLEVDDHRVLLTGDAGVPALKRALDYADGVGVPASQPDLVQMPHHGSRRNASSELLNRLLGPIGQLPRGVAFVSVTGKADPKHPSGRVVNAYARRGYPSFWTAGESIRWHSPDAPFRADYGPLEPLPPMDESVDES